MFSDIALEALAFGGEQMAREFVHAEMGPLLADTPRIAAMRETLAAYFEQGSAAGAGREVGISERAVVYRLRHAEGILERPLTERRAELETALRLHGMFAAAQERAA
jgi:DNA-binding PucR family transcriptional regulator